MASEAQINANRQNAQKSTGPQTAQGKAAVSQNAVKHGLFASQIVVKGENRGDFDVFRDEILAELAPVGPVESMLAGRVVSLSWRLKRAERIQNQAIDVMIARDGPSPLAKLAQSLLPKDQRQLSADASASNGDLVLGRAAIKDYSNSRVLDRLLMYERRIEHSMFKTMAELQRLRLTRELQEAAAEEEFAADAGSPQNNEVNCAKQSQFEPAQMNVSSCARKDYENRAALRLRENKPNTKTESRRRKAEDGEKSAVLSLRDEKWNLFRSPSDFYLGNDAKQPGTNIR